MLDANDKVVKHARRGNPYGLLGLKLALESLPAEEAFARYCELLDIREPLRLDSLRAASMYSFAKANAKVFVETGRSGEPFVNRAPRVIGESNHRDLVCDTRALYVACVENARIWGRSASIEVGKDVLIDFEDWELARLDDQLEQDPRIFRSDSGNIWYMRNPLPDADLHIARGFMLTGSHTGAFGHWIWEYLPKYVAALEAGCMPPLSVLIDADMLATHRQALERLLPEGSEIVAVEAHRSVRVDELWIAPSLIYMPLLEKTNGKYQWQYSASPVERFVPVIERIVAAYCGDDSGGPHDRQIFLARHAKRRRKMINHEIIEALAREHGFEIVYPEQFSFAEQLELIRSARYIMGPEGSAMFLAFFARPGTRLAILNHPDTEGQASLTAVLDSIGVESVVLTGPFVDRDPEWPHFSDYEIPVERFTRFLDDWFN